MNPLVPGVWDVAWSVIWVAAVVLVVMALITLFRTRSALGAAETILWVLAIAVIPVIGSFLWLVSSRRLRRPVSRSRG